MLLCFICKEPILDEDDLFPDCCRECRRDLALRYLKSLCEPDPILKPLEPCSNRVKIEYETPDPKMRLPLPPQEVDFNAFFNKPQSYEFPYEEPKA